MASEQFSLCWDNFHKNMSSGMNSLLENEDLVDVTLAVEGKCLKAHKMVLSVCSPYFKELFKSNPCQHPIVFMKDVSYVALSDLLQFMYQGEVQVSQENLTTFIKTAEALQIKGLTGDGNGSADTDVVEQIHEKPVHQIEEYKPAPRPKKQPAPVTQSPSVKRPRLSVSSSDSQPLPPASLIDETGDENFGDDALDDTNVDDTEDYSMMEGGVGEEEPQAGTSTDGAGEGQGRWFGFSSIVIPAAVLPVGGSLDELVLRKEHNHPPYHDASIRDSFIREIKGSIANHPLRPLKQLYADVSILYPEDEDEVFPNGRKPRKKRMSGRMRFVRDGFVYHNNVIAGTPPLR
ncbi:hypothetical protein NQ314_006544 [Rhamnusium bicolor]|uniref:BTB domain-containing protein n=1 Tax=Rhamnusium bicolor TaxID=1586634 RepID=A0AAV8Z021_9CUCU|nr:hypothetical protein NQ314_006544 [Rhamnusium bicolor]